MFTHWQLSVVRFDGHFVLRAPVGLGTRLWEMAMPPTEGSSTNIITDIFCCPLSSQETPVELKMSYWLLEVTPWKNVCSISLLVFYFNFLSYLIVLSHVVVYFFGKFLLYFYQNKFNQSINQPNCFCFFPDFCDPFFSRKQQHKHSYAIESFVHLYVIDYGWGNLNKRSLSHLLSFLLFFLGGGGASNCFRSAC